MTRDELTDDELTHLIGEAACASRPAPKHETLAEYLKRIADEDRTGGSTQATAPPKDIQPFPCDE